MLLIILVLLFLVDASSSFPVTLNYNLSSCYDNSTYGPNSPYVITNMNELLSTLVSQISTSKIGFVTLEKASQNDNQAIVYGLALCRGDMNPQDCHGCVDLASEQVMNECPRAVNAILWKEQCMIRYSNKSFFSLLQTHPMQISNNLENGTEDMFAWNLFKSKLDEVAYKAATDVESGKKYAIDASFFAPMNKHLYTMAQCSPDLTMDNCSKCFVQAKSASLDHLTGHGSKGCVVLMPSCSIRHEFYPFFQNEGKKRNNTAAKLVPAIIVPLAILGMLIAIGTFLFKRKNANKYTPFDGGNVLVDLASAESLIMYELKVLEVTTNGFSDDQKLGQGGFGSVYKGTLSNGQEIAVKRLSKISGQGDEEFKNEVVLIANLQHINLVKLLGFCLAREEKLLVYEFVTNKSLNYFLFGVPKEIELNWATRYNIIRGVARGLLYLHEDSRPRIIHRDLKSGNILLDANMNPKISDFGLARIFEVDQAEDNTNRVVGTYGYMAPEYAMHGQFSVKSDVYSFGVLILEIISGKKINARFNSSENGDLLTHAWRSLTEQNPLEFMDSTLIDTYSSEEVMLCIHLGLLCAQENTNERPTMSSTVLLLNNETTTRNTLPMPQRPQTFIYSSNETSLVSRLSPHSTTTTSSNSNNAMQLSKNQVTISEIHAR